MIKIFLALAAVALVSCFTVATTTPAHFYWYVAIVVAMFSTLALLALAGVLWGLRLLD